MPKVRLILEDDNGVTTEQIYDLPEGITNPSRTIFPFRERTPIQKTARP